MGQRARQGVRAVARSAVALLSVAALVATGYGWWVYRDLSGQIVTSDVLGPPSGSGGASGQPEEFTALLVGIDSRTDANGEPLPPEVLAELRAGEDEGQLNTDTIILLHVPAEPDAPAVAVSFPRDSYVPIAGGRGEHKINSAYRRGMDDAREALEAQGLTGAELERGAREAGRRTLVATVQDLAGVTVDHYAEVNLAGFVAISDALGGVPVCLRNPVREPLSGVDLPAGPQTVGGADALAFVRQRHDLPDGDLDRIQRQQAYLAGLAQRLISAGTLTDPERTSRLVAAVSDHVVLDRGWDLERIAAQLGRLSGTDLRFETIPTLRPDLRTPADGIAVEIDAAQVRRFVQQAFAGDAGPSGAAAAPTRRPVAPAAATGPLDAPRGAATPAPTPGPIPTGPISTGPTSTGPTPAGPTPPGPITSGGLTCV
ncbi:MAG TPA: LCP family protein, partial [Pseudonocardia sp.]|nr:LCP family protein [Pseudonocardia sp.]